MPEGRFWNVDPSPDSPLPPLPPPGEHPSHSACPVKLQPLPGSSTLCSVWNVPAVLVELSFLSKHCLVCLLLPPFAQAGSPSWVPS